MLLLVGCASMQPTIAVKGNAAAEHCLAFYDDLQKPGVRSRNKNQTLNRNKLQ